MQRILDGDFSPEIVQIGTFSIGPMDSIPTRVVAPVSASTSQMTQPIQMITTPGLTATPINLPPAPQIAQTLVGTPDGFQFSFNQVNLPLNYTNTIVAYRVYRNTLNVFGGNLVHTFANDPRHFGAIVFTDTIMANAALSYYYWVTSVDSQGQESTPSAAQSGAVIGNIGSTPYSNTGTFSYTSDTSSITWTWTGLMIFRADGTSTSVPDGSQAITGLTASTTYDFLPYWDDAAQAIAWVSGGAGTPSFAFTAPTQAQIAQQNYRTRIPLANTAMNASTTSSGTGGGSGGGGGGGGGRKFV